MDPLIWNGGEQPWVLTLSEQWGGWLSLLNSAEASSDVPLTCGAERREPGSRERRGRRG